MKALKKMISLMLVSVMVIGLILPASADDKPKYDYISTHQNGVFWSAKIIENGFKWGLISKTGEEIVPPKYDTAGTFNEKNTAFVKIDGKYGLINTEGKEVLKPKYACIQSFSDNKFLFNVGGRENATQIVGGKWGILNETGKVVMAAKYDGIYAFSEGMAAVKKDEKFGFINSDYKLVIKPQYTAVAGFSEGLAVVLKSKNVASDGATEQICSYIDKTGKVKFSIKAFLAASFSNGLAKISKINSNSSGMYDIFVDKSGETVLDFKKITGSENVFAYDFVDGVTMCGFAAADNTMHVAVVDNKGKKLFETYSKDAMLLGLPFQNGLATIVPIGGNGYKFVDTKGKIVFESMEYLKILFSKDGYAFASKAGKAEGKSMWGVLNKTGKVVVPAKYDDIISLSDGMFGVKKDSKFGFYNEKGKLVIPVKYDEASVFNNDLASVRKGNTWYIINKAGKIMATI